LTDVQTATVLCAECKIALQPVTQQQTEDWFACPTCGTGDTRENVLLEAKDHATELVAHALQDAARNAAKRNKFITFRGQSIPKRSYRFITDVTL
jgi:predicted RNA-binding Zn-ribbon protein involved in translation (DUF1610 family)